MSYIETLKYHTSNETDNILMYNGERVELITVFKDINCAIIEDIRGNIIEIPADKLEEKI